MRAQADADCICGLTKLFSRVVLRQEYELLRLTRPIYAKLFIRGTWGQINLSGNQ